jgi:serine protease SohB
MDVLWDTLGFAGKALIVFITIAASSLVVFARASKVARSEGGRMRVRRINDSLRQATNMLRSAMLPARERRQHNKELARAAKNEARPQKNVFVLDFKGDIMASAAENLRQEVTALLGVVAPGDEVVVRLESGGGAVTGYGFAASQLVRLKERGLALTVCVDKVAASGGYMMACVAERIIAAPFAVLGSIGVAAPMPNFHRLLDRFGVDYENFTAGEYKRTVSPLTPITDKARRKFQEQLEEVHQLFKDHVRAYRPQVDIDQVATGEHWYGKRAAELGLVNELMTSDDYLLAKVHDTNIYKVSFQRPPMLRERFAGLASATVERIVDAWQARSLLGVR